MRFPKASRSRKHTPAEKKWAAAMAQALTQKLGYTIYVILYTDPDGFPTIEFRADAGSRTYHAGYIGSLEIPETRKMRASNILKDLQGEMK